MNPSVRNLIRLFGSLFCGVFLLWGAVRCTTADDLLGGDFIPDDQDMEIRRAAVEGLRTYVTSADSIPAKNLGYIYFGKMHSPVLGTTETVFTGRYLPSALSDTVVGFGNRPVADSIKLSLSINYVDSYDPQTDSLVEQTFWVWPLAREIDTDTTYYANFDPSDYLGEQHYFSFTFKGRRSDWVKLEPTEAGRAYMQRLVETDTAVYKSDSAWYENFPGLCIRPAPNSPAGAVYRSGISTSSSTLQIFAHNYDSTGVNVKDTVGLYYYFLSAATSTDLFTVNSFLHDYSGTVFETIIDDTLNVASVTAVQGLGGLTTQIEVTDAMIESILALGENGRLVHLNQARLLIPVEDGANYKILDWAPPRVGSYINYLTLDPISDYNYYSEANNGTTTYGGYLNRSKGCYELDIREYLQQQLKIAMLEEPERSEQQAVYPRRFTVGMDAYSRLSGGEVLLCGSDETTPLSLEITYTLIE